MLKITKKKYKTNLTVKEINTINSLRSEYDIFDKTKLNMMSVLSYLVKHGSSTIEGFKKSLKDLWDMYKRYHKNIKSLSRFKDIIYKLKEHKLISTKKSKKVNIYFSRDFIEIEPTEEPTQEPTLENQGQSTDMTGFEGGEENTQIQNPPLDIYNNIYNTPDGLSTGNDYRNSEAYKKACKKNEKDYMAPVELMVIALGILKENGRRSETLKNMIRKALMDKMEIERNGAYNYVLTVVAEKVAKFEFNRELFIILKNKNKINYRAAYNKSKIQNSTFANFTQREYDYNKLEKQLLGWDDSYDDEDNCEIGN